MGLPEKIKNRLTTHQNRGKTPAKKDNVPAGSHKDKPAPIARRPEAPGLPYFQPPPLPKDHRAILVACAKTRRASWAIIKDNSENGSPQAHKWAFQRNITAAPATEDGSEGSSAVSASSGDSAGPDGGYSSQTKPDIEPSDIDLKDFSCGICRASRQTTGVAHLVSCLACNTIMCVPQATYKCPGCKAEIDTSRLSEMHSLNARQGARKTSRTPGASGRASSNSRNPQVEGPGASGTSGGNSGGYRRAIGG